jgi:hypothetical protein
MTGRTYRCGNSLAFLCQCGLLLGSSVLSLNAEGEDKGKNSWAQHIKFL